MKYITQPVIRQRLNIGLVSTALLFALPSMAEPIPEIVVTADLRRDSTLETATSVTVVTEAVIKSRAAQHFEDIINTMPNVNYASGSNRARYFQIRGIGERSQFVNPLNPSVGFLVDDVDFSGAGSLATMMDVKQVEVLRGPQGTRYGANALAGLINVTTNDPDQSRFAQFKLGAAEYGTQTIGMVLNAPLNTDFSTRLVIESHESDGYIDNSFLDAEDTNGRDELTARGKIAWQVNDSWALALTVAQVDVDNGYDAFSLDNTRTTLSDEPGFDRQDSTYFSLKSTWNFSAMDAEVFLNQSDSDLAYGYDEDWSFTGIHPFGYTSTDHYLRDRETTSIEARLVSSDAGRIFSDSTDWVVGLYYLASDENLHRQYTFLPADFLSAYDFETYALFGQLDVSLTDALILSIGARAERRDTRYSDSDGVSFSPEDDLWGGKLALEYITGQGALAYASVSRGYKAGGFNIDGSLDPDLREFDEEYLIEYEVGYKQAFADNQLTLQLAAFYDDRVDQQVKSSLVRPRPDGSTEFIDFFGNAAEGTNKGVELDIGWQVSEQLMITANAGWLDARFDEFTNEFGEDLGGRDQAHAPGYMFSIGLDYARGPWRFTASADGKDDFYFSDRHDVQSDSYTLFNASASYAADRWTATLWGRNLTDEDYFVRAFGSFGNDPRKLYVTEPYFQFGEPRIVGLTLELTLGDNPS